MIYLILIWAFGCAIRSTESKDYCPTFGCAHDAVSLLQMAHELTSQEDLDLAQRLPMPKINGDSGGVGDSSNTSWTLPSWQHFQVSKSSSGSSSRHSLRTSAAASRYSESDALTMLPSIDCVRMITLNDSEMPALLTNELKVRGLWNRTTVQTEQLDPEGGAAGCFRAHVRAWNFGFTEECANLLVLEDDAFFENDTVQIASARADAFLRSGHAYDMLFLGWNGCIGDSANVRVSQIDGADCAFQLIGNVCSTHAYVISKQAMLKFSTMEYEGLALDAQLQTRNDSIFSTVRPMSAFQRHHETSIPWSDSPSADGLTPSMKMAMDQYQDTYAEDKAKPELLHEDTENSVYAASGYGDICAM